MKKVKVLKLEELKDAQTPNNKAVGYFKEGFLFGEPKVGREFLLYMENGIPIWHTSLVAEVISAEVFKTKNSIYKIISLE
jgi:hypothetical protein